MKKVKSKSGRHTTPQEQNEAAIAEVPRAAAACFLNLKPSPEDKRDFKYTPKALITSTPTSVDLTALLPPAYDQGELGSCAAHAGAVALRYLNKKQLSQDWMPSRLALYYITRVYIMGVDPGDDSGCTLREICKAMAAYAMPPEQYFKYDVSRFSIAPPFLSIQEVSPLPLIKYRSVNRDEFSLQAALAEKLPVIVGILVYESFCTATVASTGIVPLPKSTEQLLGAHAVLLTAYSKITRQFRALNSWGSWGQKGSFTVPFGYLTNPNLCFDAWVVSDAIVL